MDSINYNTNTITLLESRSWNAQAKIWLYKKSDDKIILNGPAPDIGAYKYGLEAPTDSIPKNLESLRVAEANS
jgi:hypothetical protein